jgi:hypothetical protein
MIVRARIVAHGGYMQELIEKIQTEGEHVGGGIVKVDSFLNHQWTGGPSGWRELCVRLRQQGDQADLAGSHGESAASRWLEVAGQFAAK